MLKRPFQLIKKILLILDGIFPLKFFNFTIFSLFTFLKLFRPFYRKRSIIALGHLVMSCDQTLYLKLINMLLDELSKNQGAQNTRTYIQAIGT